MISIYEVRLRNIFRGKAGGTDKRLEGMVMFDSGRSALYAILALLRDERKARTVYVNAYTTDVVHRVVRSLGLEIRPLDIDPLTFEPVLPPDLDLKGNIFIQTDLFGFSSFPDGLSRWVHSRGGVLIEDCCNSFGAVCRGRPAGTWGDAAVYSFRIGKVLSTGGGALRINVTALRELMDPRISRFHSFSSGEQWVQFLRIVLDHVAFVPHVLQYVSRPLRSLQKRTRFLDGLAKGGVVDTLSEVTDDSIRRMHAREFSFARRRMSVRRGVGAQTAGLPKSVRYIETVPGVLAWGWEDG